MKLRLGISQAECMVDAIAFLREHFTDEGDNFPRWLSSRVLYIPSNFSQRMLREIELFLRNRSTRREDYIKQLEAAGNSYPLACACATLKCNCALNTWYKIKQALEEDK